MQKTLLQIVLLFLLAASMSAQTADEIIAKYLKTIGGLEKVKAMTSLVRTGKFIGGGGFEAVVRQENKRPNLVREEFSFQGFTGINAYNGKTGWKIEPWSGKKDVETLSEEEMKSMLEDADFDGPIIDYKEKGNKIKYDGMEPVEGTDAIKIEVAMKNGDFEYYYFDTDYYVPIKIEYKRFIRGEAQESEAILGDYKEVNGCYLPFSLEVGGKGSEFKAKYAYEKIEANVAIDDGRFEKPAPPAVPQSGK